MQKKNPSVSEVPQNTEMYSVGQYNPKKQCDFKAMSPSPRAAIQCQNKCDCGKSVIISWNGTECLTHTHLTYFS